MKDQIITVRVARLAKAAGFDLPTLKYYAEALGEVVEHSDPEHCELLNGEFAMPTQATLLKWMRDKLRVHFSPLPNGGYMGGEWTIGKIYTEITDTGFVDPTTGQPALWFQQKRSSRKVFDTYEEAMEEGFYTILTMK